MPKAHSLGSLGASNHLDISAGMLLGEHTALCVCVCVFLLTQSQCRMKGENTQIISYTVFFVYKEGVEREGGVLVYKHDQVEYNHYCY